MSEVRPLSTRNVFLDILYTGKSRSVSNLDTSDDERLEPTRKKNDKNSPPLIHLLAPIHSCGQPSINPLHAPPTDYE